MAARAAGSDAPQWVTLVSGEGARLKVERRVALVSGMIRTMLSSGGFTEASGDITFSDISTATLELVVKYMEYKATYTNSDAPIPEFHVPPESSYELLLAADYLQC